MEVMKRTTPAVVVEGVQFEIADIPPQRGVKPAAYDSGSPWLDCAAERWFGSYPLDRLLAPS